MQKRVPTVTYINVYLFGGLKKILGNFSKIKTLDKSNDIITSSKDKVLLKYRRGTYLGINPSLKARFPKQGYRINVKYRI